MCLISVFCRGVNEIFALLACYSVLIGSFRRFVTVCETLEDGTNRLLRSIGNYQSTLHKFPEERIFQAQKDFLHSSVMYYFSKHVVYMFYGLHRYHMGILDVLRFPHMPTEDSLLLDSSACMYRAAHRNTVTCFRSVLFCTGWYRYPCKERGGCRVECQQGQLVSRRRGLTVLIRN